MHSMLMNRYLFREIFHTFCAVLAILLLIALSNKVVRLLGKAASGDIAPDILLQVIFFQIPELLAFLMPIVLFLAILLAYGRLFSDNEITAMWACGIGWQRLLGVNLCAGFAVMALVAGLTCYWGPQIAQYKERLMGAKGSLILLQTLTPGRFHSFNQEGLVFYVAEVSSDRTQLKKIFIADEPKGDGAEEAGSVISAASGKVVTDGGQAATYLALQEGNRYYGVPGKMDYNVLQFQSYQRLLESVSSEDTVFYHRTMPTKMLLEEPSPANLAEFQWRISLPFSAVLLALLALPLSRVSVRAGRFSRLFPALVFCILYFNLLTVMKRFIAMGAFSPKIGLGWVHLFVFLIGVFLTVKTFSGKPRCSISLKALRASYA